VPSWLLLVWGVFGKSVGAWWGLSRASKAVGEQVEEMVRFFYQKSGNSRKFEYSNRIDQKID
jgi:hypothetical protein